MSLKTFMEAYIEVLMWSESDDFDGRLIEVIEFGPALGNALLPADVKASRWAAKRKLPYQW